MLSIEAYGAWVLLMQVATYVGLLDFGIQIAVARFVAHADELANPEQRDGIASTALVLLAATCALGLCLVGLMTWQLPHLFTTMPAYLHTQARVALLLIGGSFAIGLPFSVIHAIFIGLQRNKIPVSIVLVSRLLTGVLTVSVASRHWGLAAMGGAVALANVLSYGLTYFAWRTWAGHVKIQPSLTSMSCAKDIASYSGVMAVWSVGMLMVSGLDLTIVGIFQYSATAYYGVAVTMTNLVAQAQTTIFSAMIPASAVLQARGHVQDQGRLLVSSTRYGMLILLAMALPLLIGGSSILKVWVGAEYALHSTAIMQVLVCANVIRLSVLPYTILLLGSGQQGKVIFSPLAEGVTNLSTSLVGAYLWGAIGVAFGTVLGSFVSVGLHIFYNMPRTPSIAVDRSLLFKEGLLRPLMCAVPFGILFVSKIITPQMPLTVFSSISLCATVAGVCLFWYYGLISSERRRLQLFLVGG